MRAFIAFELPVDIKNYLSSIINTMSSSVKGVKWVSDEGLHITMKFLGEIEDKKIIQIKETLLPIENQYRPFDLIISRIDAFPNKKRPRVIVVELKNGIDIINNIFQDIENLLEKLGFEKESRTFKPHITLGRMRTPMPLLEKFIPNLEEKAFKAEDLVLFKSTLTNKGAIYDPIWKIKLGGTNT
ncbi:MAG TPA: RNA 2',3'-cyclic phosphodiesterase [Syntrophorhabdaceae bacterium]|nr:RNA 2',3'-cyclic phosphodiesterase [Syntrophorhabdaceae bacterium]HPU30334.1 RNA 2',3'-cyclic phosphodiesterase [Syntrophorhabdaceae bacterium]